MTTYEVIAERSEGWWALSVPALPGVHSQSKRLGGSNGAEEMARDAIGLFLGVDPDTVDVILRPHLSPELDEEAKRVRAIRESAQLAEARAQEAAAELAWQLTTAGVTVRDAGVLMGVSPQRISQLTAGRKAG